MALNKLKNIVYNYKRFELGRGVAGRFTSWIPEVLALLTFIKVYGIEIPHWLWPLFVLIGICGYYILGWVWERSGILQNENDYNQNKNTYVQESRAFYAEMRRHFKRKPYKGKSLKK